MFNPATDMLYVRINKCFRDSVVGNVFLWGYALVLSLNIGVGTFCVVPKINSLK